MPFDLALVDLIAPYVLLGRNLGPLHAALSVIYVHDYEVASAGEGAVIRGVARFSGTGSLFFDPRNGTLGAAAANEEGHPQNDSGRRDPWFDLRDAKIEFQLVAPREASQIIAAGAAGASAQVGAVLTAYDDVPADAPPSDYPSTAFTLDMLLTSVVLRPPFLRGAKLQPDGLLVPDEQNVQVAFTLPKIKLRLSQGSQVGNPIDIALVSAGASGLDDPGDLAVAELVTMNPPYAFIGTSNVVGFGFRSAVLDLSDGSTPPDVLAQFGYDESWTGLYLPEIRLFVAPHGMQDLAVDVGARNLLIGLGQTPGVTGDFDLEVVDQGSGPLRLSARFFAPGGQAFGITRASDTTATVALPERTRMVVDIDGGRTPYNASVTFDGGASQSGRLFDLDFAGATSKTIVISVTDARGQPPTTLTITATRRTAPALPGPGAGSPATTAQLATPRTISVTRDGTPVSSPTLKIVSQTDTSVTVSLDPPDPNTQWMVNGAPAPSGSTTTFDVAGGTTVGVVGTRPGTNITGPLNAYFHFDHPKVGEDTPDYGYSTDPNNTHTAPATDDGPASGWTGGTDVLSAFTPTLDKLAAGTTITLRGRASFEAGGAGYDYNRLLARRRADGLREIIERRYPSRFTLTIAPDDNQGEWASHGNPRNQWWRAEATFPAVTSPTFITTGEVTRPATNPPNPTIEVRDPPAPATPAPPSWFKSIGVKVRIVRNTFVACEVFGKVDFETATEERMRNNGLSGSDIPQFQGLGSQNPADGIVDFRVLVQIDDAAGTVTVIGSLGADPADRDGLVMTGALPGQPLAPTNRGRNVLGLFSVFTPVLAAVAPVNPLEGDVAQLALTGAVIALPFTLSELGWLNVERVILYGGELTVRNRTSGPEGTLLFDVETGVSANIEIGGFPLLQIDRQHPLLVRYKAIGLRMGYTPPETRFQLRPMFDASKGYTIDVSSPGTIRVPDPLGQILQVLGARVARTNPMIFEIDLGFAIDLGVVSIDRARVRIPLDPVGPPELTALAASVDIPGALRGSGYMEINSNPFEIKGQIDLTLVPVNVRIAAGIGIANIAPADGGPATAVIIVLEVQFPVAIPLANSGLGIYGFLGLFAMHYARNEDSIPAGNTAPALAWLRATGGNPANLAFWKPRINTWAFGIGALLGTMEGGIILNLKGMLLLELPGPRLLLMMKAKLLQEMPALKSNAEGNLLAVIDLDFGRGTLTIGIVADYTVDPLLSIRIPVEAFFDFNNGKNWHLYIGRYDDPVHAKIFEVFEGSGYLMISGDGIPAHGDLPAVTGFSLATGLHVSITWGSTDIGLYVRVAAGFDAVVGFEPFRIAGKIFLRGELHLFIISISAYAELAADVGTRGDGSKVSRIDGDVCGEIDLFFFSIEGCVHFHLGEDAVPPPPPPPLIKSLKLISRSPATVTGTAVDKPVDGGLGDGVEGATLPGNLPVVPIDAIPVLMMSAPPVDSALTVFGAPVGGSPGAPPDGFVQRGDLWYRYELQSVDLIGGVTVGNTPATWWTLFPPTDPNYNAQLALLSWVPTPTPKAIVQSEFLEETITDRWGTVCDDAAPPASVLWTFRNELVGPSTNGWQLDGEAWPDPADSVRSTPPRLSLQVDERWRSGDALADDLRGIIPARVEGALVPCPQANAANPPIFRPALLAPAYDPVAAIRGGKQPDPLTGERITIADALARIASGQPVARSVWADLALSDADRQPAAAQDAKLCGARVLAAPMLDDGTIIAFGDPANEPIVKQRWEAVGFKPGELGDCVVLHTGAFAYTRTLLFVRRDLLAQGRVVARVLTADGSILDEVVVTPAMAVPPNALPPQWIDPAGPWDDDVELALRFWETIKPRETYIRVLVEIKGGEKADRIELGMLKPSPDDRKLLGRPYYLAVIESLGLAEVLRSDYDDHTVKRNRGVLETAFGPESADYALLLPSTNYQVRASWKVTRGKRAKASDPIVFIKDDGTTTSNPDEASSTVPQSFWFRTDDDSPARLDPWMLCTLPAEGETQVFGEEPIKIVFGTNDVGRLYDAYGERLQVRLRASSARHPQSSPSVPHPFPIDASSLHMLKGHVLSPWEETAAQVLDGKCIPIDEERVRHSMVTIPIPLDPLTDYILDVERLPSGAAPGTFGERVYRRSFSTSRFGTLATFAETFLGTRIEHRYAAPGALQAVGAQFASRAPQGNELDAALIAAGLEPMPVPSLPRVVVFWEQANPAATPQPAAILVDGSEPLWRARPLPSKVVDPPPATTSRWDLTPRQWLKLAVAPGSDPVADIIVPAPGAQRALITLKPGTRGKHLLLALQRIAQTEDFLDGPSATDQFATIADIRFDRAPWEEE